MLERNIKDRDASIELLEDRMKFANSIFIILFVFGWIFVGVSSMIILPSGWNEYRICGIGIGLAFCIFAGYCHIIATSYANFIYLKHNFDDKEE